MKHIDPEQIPWLTKEERKVLAKVFSQYASHPLYAAWMRLLDVAVKSAFVEFQGMDDPSLFQVGKLNGRLKAINEMKNGPEKYCAWLAKVEKEEMQGQDEDDNSRTPTA